MEGQFEKLEDIMDMALFERAISDPFSYKLTEVIPGVYLGDQNSAGIFSVDENTEASMERAWRELRSWRIQNIVSCTNTSAFMDRGLMYKLLDFTDVENDANLATLRRELPSVFAFMDDALTENTGVLVHCDTGISRSATIVIAYLMHRKGKTFRDVFQFVAEKRPVVRPEFWRFLRDEFEPQCVEENAPQPQRPPRDASLEHRRAEPRPGAVTRNGVAVRGGTGEAVTLGGLVHRGGAPISGAPTTLRGVFGDDARQFEDQNLQEQGHTLESCLFRFQQGGGQIVSGAPAGLRVDLIPDDTVYSVCTQGINRSQAVYAILSRLKSTNRDWHNLELVYPHGAGNANDPYIGCNPRSEDEAMFYLRDPFNHRDPEPAFVEVFGVSKSARFGDDKFVTEPRLLEDINRLESLSRLRRAREQMRAYFDRAYFGRVPPRGRRVFIAFNRAAHIVMSRLLEVRAPVDRTFIVALDYADTMTSAARPVDGYRVMFDQLSALFPMLHPLPARVPAARRTPVAEDHAVTETPAHVEQSLAVNAAQTDQRESALVAMTNERDALQRELNDMRATMLAMQQQGVDDDQLRVLTEDLGRERSAREEAEARMRECDAAWRNAVAAAEEQRQRADALTSENHLLQQRTLQIEEMLERTENDLRQRSGEAARAGARMTEQVASMEAELAQAEQRYQDERERADRLQRLLDAARLRNEAPREPVISGGLGRSRDAATRTAAPAASSSYVRGRSPSRTSSSTFQPPLRPPSRDRGRGF